MNRSLRIDVAIRILLAWLGGLGSFGFIFGDFRWGVVAGCLSFPFLLVVLVASLFLGDRIAAHPVESMFVIMGIVGALAQTVMPQGIFSSLHVSLPAAILFLVMNWKWRLPGTLS